MRSGSAAVTVFEFGFCVLAAASVTTGKYAKPLSTLTRGYQKVGVHTTIKTNVVSVVFIMRPT